VYILKQYSVHVHELMGSSNVTPELHLYHLPSSPVSPQRKNVPKFAKRAQVSEIASHHTICHIHLHILGKDRFWRPVCPRYFTRPVSNRGIGQLLGQQH